MTSELPKQPLTKEVIIFPDNTRMELDLAVMVLAERGAFEKDCAIVARKGLHDIINATITRHRGYSDHWRWRCVTPEKLAVNQKRFPPEPIKCDWYVIFLWSPSLNWKIGSITRAVMPWAFCDEGGDRFSKALQANHILQFLPMRHLADMVYPATRFLNPATLPIFKNMSISKQYREFINTHFVIGQEVNNRSHYDVIKGFSLAGAALPVIKAVTDARSIVTDGERDLLNRRGIHLTPDGDHDVKVRTSVWPVEEIIRPFRPRAVELIHETLTSIRQILDYVLQFNRNGGNPKPTMKEIERIARETLLKGADYETRND